MAKVKGKGSKIKKGSTGGSRKRVASAAFPAENDRDEFFGSDSDAPSEGDEQEQQLETATEKRLRLGISAHLSLLLLSSLRLVLTQIDCVVQPRSTCIA